MSTVHETPPCWIAPVGQGDIPTSALCKRHPEVATTLPSYVPVIQTDAFGISVPPKPTDLGPVSPEHWALGPICDFEHPIGKGSRHRPPGSVCSIMS
jgi:hypothetical protein